MYIERPLPFYARFPQFSIADYDDDRMQERDRQIMQSYYSKTAARIQRLAEEACDRMEYDGSMMFDEYPDKLMMEHLCSRIQEELREEEREDSRRNSGEDADRVLDSEREERAIMEMMQRRDNGLRDLIGVILFNEMYCRRCRHKRRRWY